MPRIQTEYLDEHRDWRRNQLLEVATTLVRERGVASLTMTSLAKRAGLSRTSTYEYFANSDDLIANLLFEELKTFSEKLESSIQNVIDPARRIELWIKTVVTYAVSEDHLFAKDLFSMPRLEYRKAEMFKLHSQLYSSLRRSLHDLGVRNISSMERIIGSVIQVAIQSVERGASVDAQIEETSLFILSGIEACSRSHTRISDALHE
ncbi:MAG: TetR/AcrR family transcriptional regulator [Actinomycetota bacterium]